MKTMVYALVCSAVAGSLVEPTEGAQRRVPQDHTRVTDALAAAAPGETVLVAAGTYSSSVNGEVFPLVVDKSLTLIGAGMKLSILDAEGQDRVLHVNASSARVSGFTVTGGVTPGGGGGGILVFEGKSPEIDHNLVLGNKAHTVGSGIFIPEGASPWIHHNVVWENLDADTSQGEPHGVQFFNSGGLFEHNLVGRGDSNGLLTNSSTVTIRNNIFFENGTPGVRGRGICAVNGSQPVMAHNLFYGNAIAALLVAPGPGNVSGAQANDLSPSDGIYGNIDADPLFEDVDAMDWNLTAGSPAIDAGTLEFPLDPDGTRADIGPFYYPHESTGIPGQEAPTARLLVAPNPVGPRAVFHYTHDNAGRVTLVVLDLQGRLVTALVDGDQDAGEHTVPWDGTGRFGTRLPAGVYFAHLVMGAKTQATKLVVTP